MSNIYTSELISNKYDTSLDYHITMYDNFPYRRNPEYCSAQQIGMYSGHIIKYYSCINKEEAFQVNNQDDRIKEIIARKRLELEDMAAPEAEVITGNSNDITQEQIDTLLDDNANIDNKAFPDEILADAESHFNSIDDW